MIFNGSFLSRFLFLKQIIQKAKTQTFVCVFFWRIYVYTLFGKVCWRSFYTRLCRLCQEKFVHYAVLQAKILLRSSPLSMRRIIDDWHLLYLSNSFVALSTSPYTFHNPLNLHSFGHLINPTISSSGYPRKTPISCGKCNYRQTLMTTRQSICLYLHFVDNRILKAVVLRHFEQAFRP